jgi:adenylate kinase
MGRQDRRMTVIVLLGAPGAGKGTQAALLKERLGIPHVATGDLFRAAVRDGSPIGLEARRHMERGQLVPDEITIGMLLARLQAPDAVDGAILDGFPRNRPQAEALDAALASRASRVDLAIHVAVPLDELVRRLSGRWICRDAGHVYHEQSNPPQVAGQCDLDGSPLIQRDDDRPETIRARLTGQLDSLTQVVDHYRETGVLRTIDGLQTIDEVTAALLETLAELPVGEA